MKTCSVCLRALDPGEFYDRMSKCKTCTCAAVRAHRAANIEKVRAYDRERAKLPHRKQNARRVLNNWRKRDGNAARWRQEHPTKYAAHIAVGNAVRDGRLSKPDRCTDCDRAARVEAHHDDYAKPLAVRWLCKPCHAKADQQRRAA